jgi:hypothetical protein
MSKVPSDSEIFHKLARQRAALETLRQDFGIEATQWGAESPGRGLSLALADIEWLIESARIARRA